MARDPELEQEQAPGPDDNPRSPFFNPVTRRPRPVEVPTVATRSALECPLTVNAETLECCATRKLRVAPPSR